MIYLQNYQYCAVCLALCLEQNYRTKNKLNNDSDLKILVYHNGRELKTVDLKISANISIVRGKIDVKDSEEINVEWRF